MFKKEISSNVSNFPKMCDIKIESLNKEFLTEVQSLFFHHIDSEASVASHENTNHIIGGAYTQEVAETKANYINEYAKKNQQHISTFIEIK